MGFFVCFLFQFGKIFKKKKKVGLQGTHGDDVAKLPAPRQILYRCLPNLLYRTAGDGSLFLFPVGNFLLVSHVSLPCCSLILLGLIPLTMTTGAGDSFHLCKSIFLLEFFLSLGPFRLKQPNDFTLNRWIC